MSIAPVIVEATTKHSATLFFFHGLGDTGHGWSSALAAIRPPCMKVVCPTAPTKPVTLNAGFRMPAWFDLKSLDNTGPEDDEGIKAASKAVHEMINKEIIETDIQSKDIVLGGFSQGGALALFSALTYNKQLAGVVALSCWLPLYKQFPGLKTNSADIPIFQCHGNFDPVVPYKFGAQSSNVLKEFMKNASFKSYHGLQHTSSEEEMHDIQKVLAAWVK